MAVTNQKPRIERKETPDTQTEKRDDAADVIQEMWPAKLSEIAEESGYSRSHIQNTLESHFREVGTNRDGLNITIPDDVDESSYLRGFVDGYQS